MPGCFCVPGAGARCSSARAVIAVSATAEHVAATPLGVPGDAWREVVARLAGAALVAEGTRTTTGVLAPLGLGDAVVRSFTAEAQAWTTATPVVLPGRDHRRGRARPHRALARLLRHAGSAPAHRYRRPRHLARHPVSHLSVVWRTAVAGPLSLGAGAGYGLGLLVPLPDRAPSAPGTMPG